MTSPIVAKTAAPGDVLTPEGLGRLKVGMSLADAAATGLLVAISPEGQGEECDLYQLKSDGDVWAMFIGEKLTRVSIDGQSRKRTDAGFGIGDAEAEVKAAYGSKLQVESHAYDGPEAHYLTAWNDQAKRGLRYETDVKGKVSTIHGGDRTIRFVEGCL